MGKTSALERWAKGRNWVTVTFASQVISGAENCFMLSRIAREREFDSLLSDIPLDKWLSFYDNSSRVWDEVFNLTLSNDRGTLRQFDRMESFERRWPDLTGNFSMSKVVMFLNDAKATGDRILLDYFTSWREEIEGSDGKLGNVNFNRLLDIPELFFFLRVLCPCWLEYGYPLTHMLKKARNGDYASIVKLIRLDKAILKDDQIFNYYMIADRKKSVGASDIRLAQEGTLQGIRPFNIRRVKYCLAAFVYRTCSELNNSSKEVIKHLASVGIKMKPMKTKLSYRDIHKLFDVVYKDFHSDSEYKYDPDFLEENEPINEHSFECAVRKNLNFWISAENLTEYISQL